MPQPLLPRNEYFAQLYKLPLAAGVIFFDDAGRILLLKPTYRDGYLIPGGMVEANESPAQAAIREIKEELGLTLSKIGSLVGIDYKPRTQQEFDDATVQLVFNGGTLTPEQIAAFTLNPEEHESYLFAAPDEAVKLCNPKLAKRLEDCLEAIKQKQTLYLEDGAIRTEE